MSITGSNNPFACNPVVFANANSIVSLGTITRDGNQFTFSVGFVWKINGVTYQNTAPVVITIAEASEGFNRIDNALLNTSNTIELQQGLESDTIALRPVAPETNIILTSWNISGTTIGDAEASILGTQFKKKSESAAYNDPTLSGSNAVIALQPNGQSVYAFSDAELISIAGFNLDLITGNPSAETPYPYKDLFIFNNKSGDLILKHDASVTDADVKFYFADETDLIIPAGGKVWLKYGPSYCEMIFKSWIDVDLSSKADLVGGKVPASQLPAYVDDVLEFANLSAFPVTGETGIIYLALDTNFTYRWSGSAYIQIGGRKRKHIFYIPLNTTIAASTSWYGLSREIGHILNPSVVIGVYNEISNTITEARVSKFRIPFGCKLTNTRWIHSTLSTALDVKIQYFEVSGGSSVNNTTIASHQFPVNSGAADSVFSTQNNSFIMNENGYLTIVFFNNNVSTGALRSTLFEIEVEEI